MGFKIPYICITFITLNATVIVGTYALFFMVSLYYLMVYPLLIILEIVLTIILIFRGESVRVVKFGVIFLTIVFLILFAIYFKTGECCSGPKTLWVTCLTLYCVFRCMFLVALFLLERECRKEYEKRKNREKTMGQTYVEGTAQRVPPIIPGDIGFKPVTPQGEENQTGYGWAI